VNPPVGVPHGLLLPSGYKQVVQDQVFITVGYPVVVTSTIMTCFVRERSHPTLNRATIPGREHYGHHTVTPRDTQQHDVCPGQSDPRPVGGMSERG
jgi:hypothetical protein